MCKQGCVTLLVSVCWFRHVQTMYGMLTGWHGQRCWQLVRASHVRIMRGFPYTTLGVMYHSVQTQSMPTIVQHMSYKYGAPAQSGQVESFCFCSMQRQPYTSHLFFFVVLRFSCATRERVPRISSSLHEHVIADSWLQPLPWGKDSAECFTQVLGHLLLSSCCFCTDFFYLYQFCTSVLHW